MKIATFNVRGLATDPTKKENLIKDAINFKLDIVSIQETKTGEIDELIRENRLITYKHNNPQGGLGFLISKEFNSLIQSHWSPHERIAVLRFKPSQIPSQHKHTLVINVHFPTLKESKRTPQNRDELYEIISTIRERHKSDNIIIAGDFNAKIGKRQDEEEICLGSNSKGKRNINGQTLIDFCTEQELLITNSIFKHPSRHITTWEATRRHQNKLVKTYNQIDYILVKKNLKTFLKDARTYAGTLTFTDHRLVILTLNTANKKVTNKGKRYLLSQPHDFTSLQDQEIKEQFQNTLQTNWKDNNTDTDPNTKYQNITETILASRQVLPKKNPKRREDYCPIIHSLSEKQKELRLNINNSTNEELRQRWRIERNKIMHDIKKQTKENKTKMLDNIAWEVQLAPDSMKMFKAVDKIKQNKRDKLKIADKEGKIVEDDREITTIVKDYFEEKYRGISEIEPFETEHPELETPITTEEVRAAIGQLNNNKSPGPDLIKAEELKCLSEHQLLQIAEMYNNMFKSKNQIDIGKGTLILLNKPNKTKGPLENLRPIVLLSTIRKILSTITLHRIRPKVEEFLSPSQSGFRQNRSTSDIVWAHRWLKARTEKHQEAYTILGIDMSSAFDTICRTQLLQVLETFLDKDHIKLIRTLLANTSLIFSSGSESTTIKTTLGTPQGDSLSPILFTIYLEAALRDLRPKLPVNERLTKELIYADDVDLIFDTEEEARNNITIIANTLKESNLKVNEAKTEYTNVRRNTNEWKKTRKLGNLIDENEDVLKRRTLAQLAFNSLNNMWQRTIISEQKRLKLYDALITPILLYNCGTWGLTAKTLESLDTTHRKHLRRILSIHWPETISNEDLYERCRTRPISHKIIHQRWNLFGHILRRDNNIPAQTAMTEYFQKGKKKYLGRTPTSLPTILNKDITTYKQYTKENPTRTNKTISQLLPSKLKTEKDLNKIRDIAQDREQWRKITTKIITADHQTKQKKATNLV